MGVNKMERMWLQTGQKGCGCEQVGKDVDANRIEGIWM